MKLFSRIFFSFWIATVLMVAVVLIVSDFMPLAFLGNHERRFEPELAIPALSAALNVYEREGVESFRAQVRSSPALSHTSLGLFDGEGNPLVDGHENTSMLIPLARDVVKSGRIHLVHSAFRMLYACPLKSAAGKHYVAVLTISGPANRLFRPRFWFFLSIAMFPAAIVCMVLTVYITGPITKLQAAAKRLAAGELTARAGPLTIRRRDELGDLARDFDTMAAQIELLMTAQRRFVADVSHELGGPLTRMHLALALLRREFAATRSSALVRIERETDKLSNLVQQLLLLAGLEAGRIPAETLRVVSVRSLCESVVEDANFEAAHANCGVAGTRQDITILAYPNLLRRAIDNTLRNAIRYAPPGTQIELNCLVDLIRREVTIEILDCGPGVPEAMLTDIFTPFFRTAPGREANSGGTGLGLAIASEAVRLHDGTITAHNRAAGGFRVTIRLPLRTSTPEKLPDNDAEVESCKKVPE
jgi:two-component system sensor histidine kinase CpxA